MENGPAHQFDWYRLQEAERLELRASRQLRRWKATDKWRERFGAFTHFGCISGVVGMTMSLVGLHFLQFTAWAWPGVAWIILGILLIASVATGVVALLIGLPVLGVLELVARGLDRQAQSNQIRSEALLQEHAQRNGAAGQVETVDSPEVGAFDASEGLMTRGIAGN